jgi:hypothetical protein
VYNETPAERKVVMGFLIGALIFGFGIGIGFAIIKGISDAFEKRHQVKPSNPPKRE